LVSFTLLLILLAALGHGVHSASSRNDYKNIKIIMFLGSKRGPLSLVSTTEELLDRKVAAPV
jgi:hypothetical protein